MSQKQCLKAQRTTRETEINPVFGISSDKILSCRNKEKIGPNPQEFNYKSFNCMAQLIKDCCSLLEMICVTG